MSWFPPRAEFGHFLCRNETTPSNLYLRSGASGGTPRQALQAGFQGGAVGLISFGFADTIGSVFTKQPVKRLLAHGVSQGAISETIGGSFKAGALSGVVGAATPSLDNVYTDIAVASFSGGVSAKISGGKFATGAVTAAYARAFNHWGDHTPPKGHEKQFKDLENFMEISIRTIDATCTALCDISIYGPMIRGTLIENNIQALAIASDPLYSAEISYLNRKISGRFITGASRADLVYGPINTPLFVVEIKTGATRMGRPQRLKYLKNIPINVHLAELAEIQTAR